MVKLFSTMDQGSLCRVAAEFVLRFVARNPRALIALPTGQTPHGMYSLLTGSLRPKPGTTSELRFVNLDEYAGVSPRDRRSFCAELHDRLLDPWAVAPGQVRLLRGDAGDLDAECAAYEEHISEAGGLDLAILGIGVNGHIAFNEPGTPFTARTHVAQLTSRTRDTARSRFGSEVPRQGLTLGIATILDARTVLLLASGRSKAEALSQAFRSSPDPAVPASALQRHPRITLIADADALGAWRTVDG